MQSNIQVEIREILGGIIEILPYFGYFTGENKIRRWYKSFQPDLFNVGTRSQRCSRYVLHIKPPNYDNDS